MVWTVSLSGRDFGPMLAAERRTIKNGNEETVKSNTAESSNALNGLLPIAVLLITLIAVMWGSGTGTTIQEILGTADSFKALMWSSFLACICAALLPLIQKLMTFDQVLKSWLKGVETTVVALMVLILSWALADATQGLRAADFLISMIGDDISMAILPAIVFLVAAITAFSTGTSWGTMALLLPLTIPVAWSAQSVDPSLSFLMPATVAAIINGATFGDHCSPISDTTVLSSQASG